jgi:hypothetical protein
MCKAFCSVDRIANSFRTIAQDLDVQLPDVAGAVRVHEFEDEHPD